VTIGPVSVTIDPAAIVGWEKIKNSRWSFCLLRAIKIASYMYN